MKKHFKKTLWLSVGIMAAIATYIILYQPDQLVDPSLRDVATITKPVATVQPLVKTVPSTTNLAPVTPTPVSTNKQQVTPVPSTNSVSTPVAQTPDPVIANAIPPSPTNYQRTDGFENMCIQMGDGSWTTVIYQGPGGGTMYPYNGPIDPSTQSPATATGSEAWCAANVPQAN